MKVKNEPLNPMQYQHQTTNGERKMTESSRIKRKAPDATDPFDLEFKIDPKKIQEMMYKATSKYCGSEDNCTGCGCNTCCSSC